ncbi:MAG: right-handed parallel beta-helix repeat-containing protein [Lachnospirales bacterium]
MKKIILSMFLAFTIVLSLMCLMTITVYATDQVEVNGTVYYSHQTAWKKAIDGGYTFKLLGNWNATDADFSVGASSSEDDYFKNGAIYVPDGKSVTIDLNGHIIDRNLYSSRQRNGEIIYLGKNASLTIIDSVGGGYMEDGNSSNGAGGIHAKEGSRIYLKGGSIKWCKSSDNGGAVYLASGAKMYMSGGSIESCKAESAHGGAVYADTDSQFIMTGGTIKNCSATGSYYGGAVYAYHATCQFSGGTIANNTAQYGGGIYLNGKSDSNTTTISGDILISGNTASKDGGGVYADRDSKISITGGRNTFNTAGNRGGGVFAEKYVAKCDITLGGTAHILYNTGSNTTSNLTLESGVKAILTSFDSSDKARIGISSTSSDSDIILSDTSSSGEYSKYFISDKRDYAINRGYNDDGNYTDGKLHIIKGAKAASIVDIMYLRDENDNLIKVRDCDIDYGTNTVVLQLPEEQEIGNFYMKSGYNSDVASYEIVVNSISTEPVFTTVRDFSNSKNDPVVYKLSAFGNRTEQLYSIIITHDAIAGVAAVACNSAWTHYSTATEAWNRVYTEMKAGNEVQMKLLWSVRATGSFGTGDGFKNGGFALEDAPGKLTIDLNGCTIDKGMEKADGRYNDVFYFKNTNVKITDSSASKKGTITGSFADNGFSGGIYVNNATLLIDGITIKGIKGYSTDAGAVVGENNPDITIKNSIISNNECRGLKVYSGKSIIISNCEIKDNQATGV